MKFNIFPSMLGFVTSTPAAKEISTEVDEAKRILLGAAEVIERHGLAQKKLYDPHKDSMCTMAAILMASRNNPFIGSNFPSHHLHLLTIPECIAVNRLSEVIGSSKIEKWNDGLRFMPEFRVKRALRKAARL